jgi:Flp pilus assembly protein TadG
MLRSRIRHRRFSSGAPGVPARQDPATGLTVETGLAPSLLAPSFPLLKDDRGAALLEFAISLPLLVVFVVGIYDFSGAFNQKQKIAQAAQEAAIIAGAQPMSDIATTNSNPASLQAVATAVYNSLTGSGVLASGACPPPYTATGGPALTWTYSISGCNSAYPNDKLVVTINRGWVHSGGGGGAVEAVGTVVTVQNPYHWRFNSVIQLLIPGASYAAITQLNETATVLNQM